MIKKITGAAIGISMLLAAGTPAFAAISCQNFTTGSGSTNLCNLTSSKLHSLILNNTGSVFHNIAKLSNTGNNTANNNTVTGTSSGLVINSGAATTNVTSLAGANLVSVAITQTDSSADYTGANNNTGASSNNTVTINNTKTVVVGITNDGTVTHNISASAISGHNSANFNTISGGILTGNAMSISHIETMLNSSSIIIDQ